MDDHRVRLNGGNASIRFLNFFKKLLRNGFGRHIAKLPHHVHAGQPCHDRQFHITTVSLCVYTYHDIRPMCTLSNVIALQIGQVHVHEVFQDTRVRHAERNKTSKSVFLKLLAILEKSVFKLNMHKSKKFISGAGERSFGWGRVFLKEVGPDGNKLGAANMFFYGF